MSCQLLIDGEPVVSLNDPSDIADWLISGYHIPKDLLLKKLPDVGPDWDDLPLNFFWKCHKYTIKRTLEEPKKKFKLNLKGEK